MSYPKANPNDPLRIPARAYNFLLDMAEDYRATRNEREGSQLLGWPTQFGRVRNDTGEDVQRFSALGIDPALIKPVDNLSTFSRQVTFSGIFPLLSRHKGAFGITVEPIANGSIGAAIIAGCSAVKVTAPAGTWATLQTQGNVFAEIQETSGSQTYLLMGSSGSARILWCEDTDSSSAISATVAAGGTSYQVGDILTVSGGTVTTAATFKVATLSGSAVATVALVAGGEYTTTPANPASTTGGNGTGCTLTVSYANWRRAYVRIGVTTVGISQATVVTEYDDFLKCIPFTGTVNPVGKFSSSQGRFSITAATWSAGVATFTTSVKHNMTASTLQSVASFSATNTGTGYSLGDVLTVVGGTATVPMRVIATTVSSGAVTAVLLTLGKYSSLPSNPVSFTGGTGTGYKGNLTWQGIPQVSVEHCNPAGWNGQFQIQSVPTPTTFTVNMATQPTSYIDCGTVIDEQSVIYVAKPEHLQRTAWTNSSATAAFTTDPLIIQYPDGKWYSFRSVSRAGEAAVANQGTGYTDGDVLTLGVSLPSYPAYGSNYSKPTYTASVVGGKVVGVSLRTSGDAINARYQRVDGATSTSGGTGSGCTLNPIMIPDRRIRCNIVPVMADPCTPLSSGGSVLTTFQGDQFLEKVFPPYFPGEVIQYCSVATGLIDNNGADVALADVNSAGRTWTDDVPKFSGAIIYTDTQLDAFTNPISWNGVLPYGIVRGALTLTTGFGYDTDAYFDSANPTRLTMPANGVYEFELMLRWELINPDFDGQLCMCKARLLINGDTLFHSAAVVEDGFLTTNTGASLTIRKTSILGPISLIKGDYVEIKLSAFIHGQVAAIVRVNSNADVYFGTLSVRRVDNNIPNIGLQ